MGVYDQAARWAANTDPAVVVSRLQRGQASRLRFAELGESRTTPRPGGLDRIADRVFRLADEDNLKQPWLLVGEFQAQQDEDKLDNTLLEVAQFRVRARHGSERRSKYNVLAGLVYLVGECPSSVLDMTLTGGVGTRHAALVWNVARDSASAALDELESKATTWGILFWVPLMLGARDDNLVRRWLALTQLVPEDERHALRTVALCFAELAGYRPVWEEVLEDMTVTESPLVNSWIQQALDRRDLEQGRRWLLDFLQVRFPKELTPDVVATINQQPSATLMYTWYKEALTSETYADFVAFLQR